ncbi:HK97 family phage prohead protease [Clostridium botulinum]|nr:HK97 family phage prohead protease [Clostridium botulinum]
MNKEKEIRSFNTFEVRQIGEGDEKQTHIQGYALTFDTISEDLGFKETIRKGALDNCDMSDVVLNFNHDSNMILARNNKVEGVGSLKLTIDDKGLFFDAIPTNTTYARDLIENMESGIVGKCSFAFNLDWSDDAAQSWDWDDGTRGYDFRTINKINRISDCSIVVNPAYESTSITVYKRNKEEHNKELKKQQELRKLEFELMRLELN